MKGRKLTAYEARRLERALWIMGHGRRPESRRAAHRTGLALWIVAGRAGRAGYKRVARRKLSYAGGVRRGWAR